MFFNLILFDIFNDFQKMCLFCAILFMQNPLFMECQSGIRKGEPDRIRCMVAQSGHDFQWHKSGTNPDSVEIEMT